MNTFRAINQLLSGMANRKIIKNEYQDSYLDVSRLSFYFNSSFEHLRQNGSESLTIQHCWNEKPTLKITKRQVRNKIILGNIELNNEFWHFIQHNYLSEKKKKKKKKKE